jgi:hypothetical protein
MTSDSRFFFTSRAPLTHGKMILVQDQWPPSRLHGAERGTVGRAYRRISRNTL